MILLLRKYSPPSRVYALGLQENVVLRIIHESKFHPLLPPNNQIFYHSFVWNHKTYLDPIWGSNIFVFFFVFCCFFFWVFLRAKKKRGETEKKRTVSNLIQFSSFSEQSERRREEKLKRRENSLTSHSILYFLMMDNLEKTIETNGGIIAKNFPLEKGTSYNWIVRVIQTGWILNKHPLPFFYQDIFFF